MAELIITAVGTDRPGLVGDFTGRLHAAGVNLADSRMVNLRGQFAVVLLVEGADGAVSALRESLPRLAEEVGLTASAGGPSPAPGKGAAGLPFRLKTYSMDQPGIVHRVSALLSRHGVNIEELETRLESAPFDGSPIFTLELQMVIPHGGKVKRLREEIGGLCDELNCDFDLEPA